MKREGLVTSKGQLVIPAEIRRRHGIESGTIVRFEEVSAGILLRPITDAAVDRVRGIASGHGLPPDITAEPDREIE